MQMEIIELTQEMIIEENGKQAANKQQKIF